MPKLNALQQEKIISSVSGADYSNLNLAIAAIGSIKTFRIETAILLTASLVLPADVTLIIGSQGSISGAYTLTGNKTVVKFEGQNSCLGTNITFAGTWVVKEVYPEYFGTIGDGVTDDLTSINKAGSFAQLTNTKTLVLSNVYKVSGTVSATNLTLDCKIGHKIIGTNAHTLMFAGNASFPYPATYYNLTANAIEGEDFIYCTNATFLAAVTEGSLVSIISDKIFAEGNVQGEINKVHLIDAGTGKITFRDFLHDTYNTADTARVCVYPMYKFNVRGTLKIEYPIWTTGDQEEDLQSTALWLRGIENAEVNVEIRNAGGAGVQLTDCYEPNIFARTFSVDVAGEGYGCVISCATMRSRVTGNFLGSRHPIAHGGGATGVPWDSYVYNVTSVISNINPGAGFDVHDNVGSVTFNNCTAVGQGVNQAGTGGFSLNARFNRVQNCRAYNVEMAFMATSPIPVDVEITNCSARESKYGYFGNSSTNVKNLYINGLRLDNTTMLAGSYGIYIPYGTIDNWKFKDIELHNVAVGFTCVDLNDATVPEVLRIEGFSHLNDLATGGNSINVQHKSIISVFINNVFQKNCAELLYCNAAATALKNVVITNGYIEGARSLMSLEIHPELSLLALNNMFFKDPVQALSKIVYMNNGVTTMRMLGVHTEGANMDYLTDIINNEPFTNFQPVACDFVGLTALHKDETPTNTIGEETSIGIV